MAGNEPYKWPVLVAYHFDLSWPDEDKTEVLNSAEVVKEGFEKAGHKAHLIEVRDKNFGELLKPFDPGEYIVMNLVEEIPGIKHGEGMAARIISGMGFTFSGAEPDILELSFDKVMVKRILENNGLHTPASRLFENTDTSGWDCFPCIVKPAFEHCSTGISSRSVASTHAELTEEIGRLINNLKQAALVEDFIDGREFHVTVWGNDPPEMLPVAEMDFSAFKDYHDRLCTYEAKFAPESAHYKQIETLLPAPLEKELLEELERTVIKTYRVFGCRDYARFDLRLRDGIFYILDVNPNADISHDASMAYAAEVAGYTYGEFCSKIVGMAAKRKKM